MTTKIALLSAALFLTFAHTSVAKEAKKDPALSIPECKIIEDACKATGFIIGEWEQDNGLWKQCAQPIAQGQDVVRSKEDKELKSTPELVAAAKACLEKKPKNPKKVK